MINLCQKYRNMSPRATCDHKWNQCGHGQLETVELETVELETVELENGNGNGQILVYIIG